MRLVLLCALALAGASGVAGEAPKMKLGADGKALYLVSKPDAAPEALVAVIRDLGLESSIVSTLNVGQVPATIVRTDAAGASACKAHGLTVRADKWTMKLADDTLPWGLDRIDQPSLPLDGLYTSPYGGGGATLFVADDGVDASHAAFAGRTLTGVDFVMDADGDHLDVCDDHGTHVAATAAGVGYGVAPLADIVSLKVCSCFRLLGCSHLAIIAAFVYAQNHTATKKVINLSLSGPGGFTYFENITDVQDNIVTFDEVVADTVRSGVTVVTAAGNDNWDACVFSPGNAPAAINVGAVRSNDRLAPFTNWGPCVDIFAPGVGVLSAEANTTDGAFAASGTSMAAPHVAGVALQIAAAYDTSDPLVIRAQILALAKRGVVDEDGALKAAKRIVPGVFPVTRMGGPPLLLQALTYPLPPLPTDAPEPSDVPINSEEGPHNVTVAVFGDQYAFSELWMRLYKVNFDLTHEIAMEQNGGFPHAELVHRTAMLPAGEYMFVASDAFDDGYDPASFAFHAIYVDGTLVHQTGSQWNDFSDLFSFTITDDALVCCPVGCMPHSPRRLLDQSWLSRRSLLFGSFTRKCPPGCVSTAW
ncbi:hypothetical protein KFE25_005199 [Diacronema lutheri]|uniref:Peptidase S8/S53 domain-containing protein n=1 Tax=Diacronema lutheri TaxID=2081491 RepID=A0A8J5X929_DIALT|nr:hypothetical protein KFE25_005199 [Diacronema lutheri]